MSQEHSLYLSAVGSFRAGIELEGFDERLTREEQDFHFAMHCNGLYLPSGGEWTFGKEAIRPFLKEFEGQKIAFFGPNQPSNFFSDADFGSDGFRATLSQQSVTDVIRRYRNVDENLAARIAFILGGVVRQRWEYPNTIENIDYLKREVEFVARMCMLGGKRSADAIAAASTIYVLSGGSLRHDNNFAGSVYHMAEAVSEDHIDPLATEDLGLSQVARLRSFFDKIDRQDKRPFPNIKEEMAAFEGFPTVGAEFHFQPEIAEQVPDFWKKLALLNMSAYQKKSYVQTSRNDRGVIEVRMNPSIYPVTIANWSHMKRLLPELDKAFFTITINRQEETDFTWESKTDRRALGNLRGLGFLIYAGMFENVPERGSSEEIDFGAIYLGQTVKVIGKEYKFTGLWGGNRGRHGQLGIYAGYGENLPYLAYYLSMGLADPRTLSAFEKGFFRSVESLEDALAMDTTLRKNAFQMTRRFIDSDPYLSGVTRAGDKIIDALDPDLEL